MAQHPNFNHKLIASPKLPSPPVVDSNRPVGPTEIQTPGAPAIANGRVDGFVPNVPATAAVEIVAPANSIAFPSERSSAAAMGADSHASMPLPPMLPTEVSRYVPAVCENEPLDEDDLPLFDRKTIFMALPSWLTSTLVHLFIVLLTALFMLPKDEKPRPFELVLGEASAPQDDLDEAAAVQFTPMDTPTIEEAAEVVEELEVTTSDASLVSDPLQDFADSAVPNESPLEEMSFEPIRFTDFGSEAIAGGGAAGGAAVPKVPTIAGGLGLRSAQSRLAQVLKDGGSKESEESVARALRWLAKEQRPDGGWDLAGERGRKMGPNRLTSTDNAATGLALLPFLGAGHTHKQGEYRYVVERGLHFLLKKMKVRGAGNEAKAKLTDEYGTYYSHGLCTIAMCEAYAMTRDPVLRMPAQQLINEIVHAQNPSGGGWRYESRQSGDTSVLGWQLMALKSGKMAYLNVPDKTFRGARKFLNSVQKDYGASYGYTSRARKSSTTAVGLLSRMYLGWDRDVPALEQGVNYLAKQGPDEDAIYFSYYATQVLHHYGGRQWKKWNVDMRDSLVNSQVRDGEHDGSWKLNCGHTRARLYCTSMATMILEVYYRHMPLYAKDATNGAPL